ncbi:deoxynucleoside kinase [Limosilactobacillus reuteri]|uniref:deoxynucleoside kinase n=1 Tax=Limosilactobacillus reuteri TaxID=1598 RepID=UPI000B994CE2|nr:deoxynucleoside kinase [Limosilactobacillus reuteri]OYS78990.1 deoxynucleoside kinase [Limosilactobacillus reuteri]OYS82696.1 deoxynucleoside kinase [Limosilactobacillus reuteri]OYS84342.1 deoxynucleoside kinase [Limosilactobacillus reuteri]
MIYINAPISLGKTSLAKILAKHLGTRAYLEDVNKIPLLSSFYSDGQISRENKAYAVQIEFLSYRYRQLMDGIYREHAYGERNTVYDSSLLSDGLMSKNLYNRGEFPELLYKDYLKLSQDMQANVAGYSFEGPDLIIYLSGSFDLMLHRIAKRGRKIETTDPKLKEYYHSVWTIYNDWFNSYGQAPVLKIDADQYDFVENLDDQKAVLNQIDNEMHRLGMM